MSEPTKTTLPYPGEAVIVPVSALRAEVTEGPLAGRAAETEHDTLQIGSAEDNDLVIADDPTVSRYHVELSREDDGILVQDHGSTNGTFFGEVRIERAVVPPGASLRLGRTGVRVRDGQRRSVELPQEASLGPLRGSTVEMRRLFARVRKAAESDVPVLLVGESGTGKELIARALHDESKRRAAPFEVVDCASLTPTLVASELFGHEKGAFTGAHQRHVGAFERAEGGTVFLDEIGELPETLQPSLLGVLERHSFRRLGGKSEIKVDVRVVSATNRDLRGAVNAARFRLDLYYRIAVVRLLVPPLRDRASDIPLLVEAFLRDAGETRPVAELIGGSALGALARHHWPGNVRELRNYVDAMVAMGETPELDAGLAVDDDAGERIDIGALLTLPYRDARAAVLSAFEKRYLPTLLEASEGNVSRAARDAGMDRSHLFELLRRHGLK